MTTRKPAQAKKFPLIPVLVGLGTVALIATVLLTMNTGVTDEYGDPSITGDALPRAGAAVDPALGLVAPEVEGADFEGDPVAISHDTGKAKILIFLAHWCPHCQAEVPVVQQWLEDGRLPANVELIGIATNTSSTRPNYPPSEWLDREGWTSPLIVDDTGYSMSAAYGLDAFPFWVFLAPDGTVVARDSGELPVETLDQIAQTLAALVTE